MKPIPAINLLLVANLFSFSVQAEENQSKGNKIGQSAYHLRSGIEKIYTPVIDLIKDTRTEAYRLMYKSRSEYDQFIYDIKKGDSEPSGK